MSHESNDILLESKKTEFEIAEHYGDTKGMKKAVSQLHSMGFEGQSATLRKRMDNLLVICQ